MFKWRGGVVCDPTGADEWSRWSTVTQNLGVSGQFHLRTNVWLSAESLNFNIYILYFKVFAILLQNLSKPHVWYGKMRININNFFNFGITIKRMGKKIGFAQTLHHFFLCKISREKFLWKTHFWVDQNNIEQKKAFYGESIIKSEPKRQKNNLISARLKLSLSWGTVWRLVVADGGRWWQVKAGGGKWWQVEAGGGRWR